jgi:pseudaminic acid synthase
MSVKIRIGERAVGAGEPVFIIAELSANHRQNLEVALRTIDAAADAGADAVKLQTYTPDTMTVDADSPHFHIDQGTIWDGRRLYDLYREAYMPWEWHEDLRDHAIDRGLVCFSSVFDSSSVRLMEELDTPAYKIASFEITDIPLIREVARTNKPVILSTGVADIGDIELALKALRQEGNEQVALLKCVSTYPTVHREMNLRTLSDMRERFGTVVGLSDHSMDNVPVVASIALGASIIEKHIILDRALGGPDAAFSLDAEAFAGMVRDARAAEAALGEAQYELSQRARRSREHARSLFVVEAVSAGDPVTALNVRSIRPSGGLHPKHLPDVIGRRFREAAPRGTPLDWRLLE